MLDKIKEFIAQPIPQQILYFEEMLTPKLIRLAYWLALVAVVWTGLERIFSGGVAGLLEGIVHIVGGAIAARVVAEIVMLFFQMQNDMELLRKNSEAGSGGNKRKKVTKKAAST